MSPSDYPVHSWLLLYARLKREEMRRGEERRNEDKRTAGRKEWRNDDRMERMISKRRKKERKEKAGGEG